MDLDISDILGLGALYLAGEKDIFFFILSLFMWSLDFMELSNVLRLVHFFFIFLLLWLRHVLMYVLG